MVHGELSNRMPKWKLELPGKYVPKLELGNKKELELGNKEVATRKLHIAYTFSSPNDARDVP